MTTTRPAFVLAAVLAVLAGCGGGLSKAQRDDITTQMLAARPPIAACYGSALQDNRRLHGLMKVDMIAAGGTGQFQNIVIVHDELRNPTLRDCLVSELGRQRLAKPSKSALKIHLLSFRFAPNK